MLARDRPLADLLAHHRSILTLYQNVVGGEDGDGTSRRPNRALLTPDSGLLLVIAASGPDLRAIG